MSILSAVLKPNLYCGIALCIFLSQSINRAQAAEASVSDPSTGTPKNDTTKSGNSVNSAKQANRRDNNNNAASTLNLGPAKPLALPKINTPSNFANPQSFKIYKNLDATTYASEDDIVINVDDNIATYKAKSQEVAINGNGCKITITGKCSSLVINGSNNVVKLETVSEIVANGDRNQVRWLQGPTTDKSPVIANNGSDNDIAKINKAAKTP
jgi:hypothetical protein